MKCIPLSRGKTAIVDETDFIELSKYKWYADVDGYALRTNDNVRLHRLIMQALPGQLVDHIDGNTSDNRRVNLRICTQAENIRNRGKPVVNSSGYKGVSWDKARQKWQVHIAALGVRKNLGRFVDKLEAARAYDTAAKIYHGEFARLNFPEGMQGEAHIQSLPPRSSQQ